MTNVPEQPGGAIPADTLCTDLLNAVPPADLIGRAALDLLIDLPGDVYATTAFARYLLQVADGTRVNWAKLGFDLQAGDDELPMKARDRALLMLAASIGADHAVRVAVGALLKHLDPAGLNLVIGALQHAGGVW